MTYNKIFIYEKGKKITDKDMKNDRRNQSRKYSEKYKSSQF